MSLALSLLFLLLFPSFFSCLFLLLVHILLKLIASGSMKSQCTSIIYIKILLTTTINVAIIIIIQSGSLLYLCIIKIQGEREEKIGQKKVYILKFIYRNHCSFLKLKRRNVYIHSMYMREYRRRSLKMGTMG